MQLNDSQRAAIGHSGRNLQLIACAGSGKTEVVARRVVHLLDPEGPEALDPRNIIAFTFTEKAAAELKERIVSRTREALGPVPGMAELYVGTIHAFCLELLKSEVAQYLKYEVLNDVQQNLFIDRHSRQSGLTACTDLKGRPLSRYKDTPHYRTALSIIREAEVVEEVLADSSVVGGLAAYRELLDDKTYFDYSSILECARDVLRNDGALSERISERVKYVVVDEYQDVNPVQEDIVRVLHDLGSRICVVGDDDQTIYQWRGSDVENILTFTDRYPEVDTIPIEENYRSSEGIVETARPFIEQNQSRLKKHMKPAGRQGFDEGDIVALAFENADEEAEYIASTIQSLRGISFVDDGTERGLCWSDMAILLRSVKGNAAPITKALEAAGIRFVVTGMANLFDTPEANAARKLFYFMASAEDVDEKILTDAWNDADLGIDADDLERAIVQLNEARDTLSAPDQQRWGLYSIQRVFLNFLESARVREERIPDGRGEVAFYNLGKFSQVISDFEQIHFHSRPADKYDSFASFLKFGVERAYPEGWQDNQYANPDAVRIMTVHQAKGMQWPVVFTPALLRNRFPQKKPGGRNVWHILPRDAIKGQERYEGTEEDERRLFYVAMTRSQKFLHMTWGPVPGNSHFQRPSRFWETVLASKYVKRKQSDYGTRKRAQPVQRAGVSNVVFTFSDLKYFFECPYQFKLRVLYGFNPPIHEALGYGKSLHDALADVHSRAIRGEVPSPTEAPGLVHMHLRTPFAYPRLRADLEQAAENVIRYYLEDNADMFGNVILSEQKVEIGLDDGISVLGRIDLVRRIDTGEVTIVDLKSSNRAQPEEVTETQLHVYALGYEELTGERADHVEIYELDERTRKPRSVDAEFIADVKTKVQEAAVSLRTGNLQANPHPKRCTGCDYRGMCSAAKTA